MEEGPRPVDLFQVTCGQQVEKAWLKPRLYPLLPMASMGLLRHQVGTHRGWPRSPRAVCFPLSLPMHRHHWQLIHSCLPGKVPYPKTLSLGQARMVGHLMFMKILRGSSPKLVFSSASN